MTQPVGRISRRRNPPRGEFVTADYAALIRPTGYGVRPGYACLLRCAKGVEPLVNRPFGYPIEQPVAERQLSR